jgi:hypothetical protein
MHVNGGAGVLPPIVPSLLDFLRKETLTPIKRAASRSSSKSGSSPCSDNAFFSILSIFSLFIFNTSPKSNMPNFPD